MSWQAFSTIEQPPCGVEYVVMVMDMVMDMVVHMVMPMRGLPRGRFPVLPGVGPA